MRPHVLSFLVGAVVLGAVAACGPTTKCSTSNCSGCCDAAGACVAGSSNLACGSSGATCTACQGSTTCNFGVCGNSGVGGGTATGGGGGTTGGGTGGGTTGGGGGGGTITVAQLCSDVVDAQMAYLQRCGTYSSAGAAEYAAYSKASCINGGSSFSGLKDGRVTVSTTNLTACLNALSGLSCTGSTSDITICQSVMVGQVAAGGMCFDSPDCTMGLYCDTRATCPGVCAARVALGQPLAAGQECVANAERYNGVCTALVASGQSCAPTGGSTAQRGCQPGSRCSSADVCVSSVRQAMGQACNTVDLDCGEGLQCVASVCSPLVTVGNACDTVRRCQQDLSCSAANVCVGRGAAGAACASGNECKFELFCNKPSGSSTGTCAARRTVDQTCSYNGYECASDLYCTATFSAMTGVCKAPIALGGACTYGGSYNQCAGATYCTGTSMTPAGVCANQKSAGATCSSYAECLSSNCTMGTCGATTYCFDPTP